MKKERGMLKHACDNENEEIQRTRTLWESVELWIPSVFQEWSKATALSALFERWASSETDRFCTMEKW
jgi:hypothetical protein